MGKQIDQRVVEMRFDNKQFESATKTTLGTLQKLKEALNLSNSGKALEGLAKTSKEIDIAGIAAGVEALNKRFSTLGIVGMQVIKNITNGLMNTLAKGIKFVDDAIVSGGIKRAMNLENARFQLQSIIKDEIRVAEVMKVANDSVDGTAYSFDVAAKAASQFTASGITDMDRMAEALRGMAGVTATFNADYEQMSMIFTQVAGQGRLMGDQLLQLSTRGANAAATIAEFVNGVTDGSIEARGEVTSTIKAITQGAKVTEGDIREFVSKGKINFDIFASAMSYAFGDSAKEANKTFNGALANMKAALARIGAGFFSPLIEQESAMVRLFNALRLRINDVKKSLVFDEALGNVHALSKQVTDSILALADGAAKYFETIDISEHMSTFYYWVEIIKNGAKGIVSVLKPVGQAFKEVFLNFSIIDVKKLSASIHDFSKGLILSEESSRNLKDAFKGVFDVVRSLFSIFVDLTTSVLPLKKHFDSTGGSLLELAGSVGRALSKFSVFLRTSTLIEKTTEYISLSFKSLYSVISDLVSAASKLNIFSSISNVISKSFEKLTRGFDSFRIEFKPFSEAFSSFVGGLKNISSSVINAIRYFGDAIKSFFSSVSGETMNFSSLSSLFGSGILVGIGVQLSTFIKNITNSVEKTGGLLSGIKGTISGVTDTLKAMQNSLKADNIKTIAISIGILAGSLLMLSSIDSNKLNDGLSAVTILLVEMIASFSAFEKISGTYNKNILNLNSSLVVIAASILILSSSLTVLSTIDVDKICSSLVAITILIAEMTAASIILSKYGGKIKTGALGIISFSASILILTSAVNKLSSMDTQSLTKGLISLGVILSELSAFMVASKFGKFGPTKAAGILVLSAALLVLNESLKNFSNFDDAGLKKGLISLGVILSELSVFTAISGNAKHLISVSASVIAIAKSISILEAPLSTFSKMSIAEIGKSLLTLGGSLGAISLAISNMPKNSLSIGVSLLAISESVVKLGESLSTIAKLSIGEIAKGIIVFASSMGVISIGLNSLKGSLGASAAILVLSSALTIFVPILLKLSSMSISQIAIGLLALGSSFAILGASAAILSPLIPSILGLSGAIALLGIGAGAVGAGVLALSIGLTSLSVSGVAAAASLVEVIKILTVGFLNTIAESAVELSNTVKTLILVMCDTIIECVPEIIKAIVVVITNVLQALNDNTGNIVTTIINIVTQIIDAISFNMPKIVESIMDLFSKLVSAIMNELNGMDFKNLMDGLIVVGLLTGLVAAIGAVAPLIPSAMTGVLGIGAIALELSAALAILGAIGQIPGLKWFISEGGKVLDVIGGAIGNFVGGLLGGIMESMSSRLPTIADGLSEFIQRLQPFIEGVSGINNEALSGVKNLVALVLGVTAANFLDSATKWLTGGNSMINFANELLAFGPAIAEFSKIIKDVDPEAISGAAAAASMLSELANNLPDSGGLKSKILGDNKLSDFGAELLAFGPDLRDFANIIKEVDSSSVSGAVSAGKMLSELAATIPKTGGLQALFTGDNSLDGFGEKLVSFGKSLKEYSDSVSDIDLIQLAGVVTAFKSLIDASTMVASVDTSALGKFAKALKEMSNNAIQEFVSGFQNGTERVRKAIDVGVEGWAKSIKSNEKTIAEAAKKLIEAMVEKVNTTIKAEFQTVVKGMNALGKQIIEALDKGVRSNVGKLKETGALMGKTFNEGYRESLDYRSPPHVIYEQAAQIGTAMINGVDSKLPLVEEAGKKLGTTMQKSISEGFQVDKSYEVYGDSLLKPIENVVAKTDTLTKKMQNSNVERTKLTKQGTKAAKAAHQEAIQEEKDYWEKLLEAKRQGLEAEKYMEMSIQDFRKEVLEGAKDALQNYMDQLDSTRDSIMGQMSLFDEVEEQEYKTKEELIQNLNDQIDAYQEYVDLLTSLNERLGTDSSLGEYLRQLGVDSLDQLREINTMTDSELSDYAMLYDDKLALANQAAIQQLTTLQADTEAQLANLFGGMSSAVDLFDFAAIFDGSIESITKYVNDIMVPLQNAQIEAETASQAIAKAVAAGLADESAFSDAEGNMKEKLQTLIDNIKADKEASATDAGKEIGGNLTEGVSEGIVEDTSTITDKANELMNLVEQAMKEAGEIHSPSMRSNREIGQPITSGIGVGMIENAQEAENAGKELITRILEAMKTMTTDLGTTTTTLVQVMTTAIQNEQGNFSDRGVESLRSFIGGIRDTFDELENTTNAWIQLMMTIFHDRKEEYFDKGVLHALRYVAGMDSEHDSANRAGTDFTNVALKAIEALADEFRVAGEHAGQGFVNGILSKVEAARQAARELAAAAHEAAKSELDEASPSKKLFKIGDYGGIGFVNGLMANISKAHYAGKALAEEAGDSAFSSARNLSKVIDGALDLDPVIRPQIDLSDVNRSAQTIDRLFNEAIKEAGIKADMAALGMSVRNRTNEVPVVAKSSEEDGKKVEISLTQINQSPKALSRIEIYRQTKNLLSSAKGFADK